MKAMVLTWEYPPYITGGLGQHVKELLPALLALDPYLELHVVAPCFDQPAPSVAADGPRVHWVHVAKARAQHFYEDVERANRELAATAVRVAEEEGPFDLLHVHDWLGSWAAFAVQEQFGTLLVATIHATERGRYQGHLYDHLSAAIDSAELELCQRADHIITCSSAMKHEVGRYFAVESGRISVIPNAIDGRRFDALRAADLSDFRGRFALPHEQIVFNVGRLVYEKGADLLLEAAPIVLQAAPHTRFVIAGEGPLGQTLQYRVADLGIESHVALTGFLNDDDRDKLYVVADCCVFPSRYEPFGIVALESMAAGTPVIVADVGGLGTVVQHEKTGWTAYSENVDSLAAAITQTLNDPAEADRLAGNALHQVKECFSWQVIAGLTLRVYANVMRELELA